MLHLLPEYLHWNQTEIHQFQVLAGIFVDVHKLCFVSCDIAWFYHCPELSRFAVLLNFLSVHARQLVVWTFVNRRPGGVGGCTTCLE
jgi:hypothetical protein